jgi:uncharacterized membrane protein YkoI
MLRVEAILSAWMIASLIAPALAADQGDRDSDLARDLYLHGEIRALADVLAVVRAHASGDVVSIRLARVASRWIYEFLIVDPDGRLVMVDADASAATILDAVGAP